MLIHIPAVLGIDDLREARALLADAPWSDGRASAGPQAATAKNNEQLPHDC
jgi:PKHD-type hydroxylase